MRQQVPVPVHGASLHRSPSQTASIAFSSPAAPSTMRNYGRCRRLTRVAEDRSPGFGAFSAKPIVEKIHSCFGDRLRGI